MNDSIINKPCENPNFKPDLDAETTHCDHCDKHVVNLTRLSDDRIEEWGRNNPGSCVTVRNKKKIRYPKTLMVALLLNSAAGYATLAHAVTLNVDVPFVERCIIATEHSRAVVAKFTDGLFQETVQEKFNDANHDVTSGGMSF